MFYNINMRKITKASKIFLLSIFFLWPNFSLAVIEFTDGYWSTNFDDAQVGETLYGWSYQGLQVMNSYMCGGAYSSITETDIDAKGSSGKVYRVLMEGNNRNIMTSPVYVNFPTPIKEFWLRFYYRIPVGQTIGGIFEHKIIYAFTDSAVAARVNWPNGADGVELQFGNTMGSGAVESFIGGWATIYGNGQPADGSWHYFEFHFDLGTSGNNNGITEVWVDGVRRINATELDYFDGGNAFPSGWESMSIPSNHNVWATDGCQPHDVDEIAIALPGYAGFIQDVNDRDIIGEIYPDPTHPNSPSGLTIL